MQKSLNKKIIGALILILMLAAPSYAVVDQNPVKKIIRRIASFFRENPFARQRRLIQQDYDNDKISKEEYDNRLDDVDRQQAEYEEMQRQVAEQRRQATQ